MVHGTLRVPAYNYLSHRIRIPTLEKESNGIYECVSLIFRGIGNEDTNYHSCACRVTCVTLSIAVCNINSPRTRTKTNSDIPSFQPLWSDQGPRVSTVPHFDLCGSTCNFSLIWAPDIMVHVSPIPPP